MENIIFDIGNVLCPFDYGRAYRRLNGNRPPDDNNIEKAVAERMKLEQGQITSDFFLAQLADFFDFRGSREEVTAIFEDVFEPNEPMLAFVGEIAGKGLPVYLLSNISDLHKKYVHRKYEGFKHFRNGIYSYEEGMMKPDPDIFRRAVAKFGITAANTLYIDDMAENIEAAAGVGFQTLHYDYLRHSEAENKIRQML